MTPSDSAKEGPQGTEAAVWKKMESTWGIKLPEHHRNDVEDFVICAITQATAKKDKLLEAVTKERDAAIKQARLGWERHAEKDRYYGDALAERDSARAEVESLKAQVVELQVCLKHVREIADTHFNPEECDICERTSKLLAAQPKEPTP